jgi:hypothetical protein
MYINCCAAGETGIPPKGSVTIRLPLYSPLVPPPCHHSISWPLLLGSIFAINFYKAPANTATPAVLKQHCDDDQNANRSLTPTSNPPSCTGCSLHLLHRPQLDPQLRPATVDRALIGRAMISGQPPITMS